MNLTWIYLIRDKATGYHKIGKSNDPAGRLKTLCHQDTKQPVPNEFVLIEAWWTRPAAEKELHKTFRYQTVRGEWFDLDEKHISEIYKRFALNQRFTVEFNDSDPSDTIYRQEQEIKQLQREIEILQSRLTLPRPLPPAPVVPAERQSKLSGIPKLGPRPSLQELKDKYETEAREMAKRSALVEQVRQQRQR